MDIKQDVWENVVGYMKIEATKEKHAREKELKNPNKDQDTAVIEN